MDERAPEPGMENEAVEPEVFEQDGPDLFGDEESPRLVMPVSYTHLTLPTILLV